MFDHIKNYFKRRREEKEAARIKREAEIEAICQKKIEMLRKAREDNEKFLMRLQYLDDYIEYSGKLIKSDYLDDKFFFTDRYDYTNAYNNAQNLMYNKLRSRFGDKAFDVHVIDVPYPYDNNFLWDIALDGNTSSTEKRRLYYKAHIKGEKCPLCENEPD